MAIALEKRFEALVSDVQAIQMELIHSYFTLDIHTT